ncbi:MAG: hypothetical protein DRJ47_02860 [Thermoprotei archaeon]|nr:MAG: hypothetical protein DRJ47_02860 [Thermoprotei archaeon]
MTKATSRLSKEILRKGGVIIVNSKGELIKSELLSIKILFEVLSTLREERMVWFVETVSENDCYAKFLSEKADSVTFVYVKDFPGLLEWLLKYAGSIEKSVILISALYRLYLIEMSSLSRLHGVRRLFLLTLSILKKIACEKGHLVLIPVAFKKTEHLKPLVHKVLEVDKIEDGEKSDDFTRQVP